MTTIKTTRTIFQERRMFVMAFVTAVLPMMILGMLLEAAFNPIGFFFMFIKAIIETFGGLPF